GTKACFPASAEKPIDASQLRSRSGALSSQVGSSPLVRAAIGTAPSISSISEKAMSVLSQTSSRPAEWRARLFRARPSGWAGFLEADHQRHEEDRNRDRQRQHSGVVGHGQFDLAR